MILVIKFLKSFYKALIETNGDTSGQIRAINYVNSASKKEENHKLKSCFLCLYKVSRKKHPL